MANLNLFVITALCIIIGWTNDTSLIVNNDDKRWLENEQDGGDENWEDDGGGDGGEGGGEGGEEGGGVN